MNETWKSTLAGILDIIAGTLALFGLIFFIIGILVFIPASKISGIPVPIPMSLSLVLLFALAPVLLTAQILAIIGGIYAIKRKLWGLALTGSIAAVFCSSPLGIAAIVFTILSKSEFEQQT